MRPAFPNGKDQTPQRVRRVEDAMAMRDTDQGMGALAPDGPTPGEGAEAPPSGPAGSALHCCHLPQRAIVTVTGVEAKDLLEGLLTNGIARLQPGEAAHAALLTPQGKVLFDMIVVAADPEFGGGYWLDCPAIHAEGLVKRLTFYKLRMKVTIDGPLADHAIMAIWGAPLPALDDLGFGYPDPRWPALGLRAVIHPDQEEALAAAIGARRVLADAHRRHRVALTIPEVDFDFRYGEVFPHELSLDMLGSIDFRKGCYVGQEVVSRMEHRGTARTRLIALTLADGLAVEEGAEVRAGERVLGHTGSSEDGRALAILRLDRLEGALAAGETLTAGGLPARPAKPVWWTAPWPFPP